MTTPTAESLLPLLCTYDPRNPDYADMVDQHCNIIETDLPPAQRDGCGCNNCFYGRAPLASALLAMIHDRA